MPNSIYLLLQSVLLLFKMSALWAGKIYFSLACITNNKSKFPRRLSGHTASLYMFILCSPREPSCGFKNDRSKLLSC